MRFASYNIHGGIGVDGHFVPRRIADVLAELRADVIALQEVESSATGFDMLGYLQHVTGLEAIAGPNIVRANGGDYGNGLLTRFPAAQIKRLNLSVHGHEPRGALDVQIGCETGAYRVIATHLGLRPAERRRQVRQLLRAFESGPKLPTILMGDINEWFLWGRTLGWLHAYFRRTPAPATFPARFPLLALDRIWVKPRGSLKALAAHRTPLAQMASDHLPVLALVE
jgi:endonuclease/exonuclease/phosphatase family metal-dependent hydrolase